jgi:hypothetical protein
MSNLSLRQAAGVELVSAAKRTKRTNNQFDPKGTFTIEHWRDGTLCDIYRINNGVVNEGKNKILDVMFHGTSAITAWYIGLIDLTGYTALASDDTYDDIDQAGNGWDEFTDYTDANNGDSATTRPAWPEGAASGQSITNSTPAIYDITSSGTVKGVFVVGGGSTPENKGDHAPGSTLWATALFTSGDVTVANGDQLKVTYTVTA